MSCNYTKCAELTYSYGGHLKKTSKRYYVDTIQISRCCLLEPSWYISYDELLHQRDIFTYIKKLGKPKVVLTTKNHPMCKGCLCDIEPNEDIDDIIVGLSYACDLNCYNCWFAGYHFDTEEQKRLYFHTLYGLKGHSLNSITLTNKGEPFFYAKETMDFLKSLSLSDTKIISVVTSGNKFTKDIINDLRNINKFTGIGFSLVFSIDAISAETYNKVRFGGDFEKVLKNLEQCIKLFGNKEIEVSFTCKEPNIAEISKAKEFFKSEFGIKTNISFDYFHPELEQLAKEYYGYNLVQ